MNDVTLAAVAVGDQIERFGAYFGYAAIIGLGVLSMLYFVQAREVRRLREWAGRAPERDAELAQRVQADAQRRPAPPAVPAAVAQPASPQTVAAQQADAARRATAAAVMQKFQQPAAGGPGVVGPAGQLARAIPPAAAPGGAAPGSTASGAPSPVLPGATAAPASPPVATAAPAVPGTSAAAEGASGSAPSSSAPNGPGASAASASGTAAVAMPAPSAAQPGPAAALSQTAPSSRSLGLGNGSGGQDTQDSAAARPSPPDDLPPRPPRSTASSAASADEGGLSGGRIGLIVGAIVAVLAIGLVVVLLSSGGDKPAADNAIREASTPPAAGPATPARRVDRKATQVAVLNGTTQTGLARDVGNKLQEKGFTILSVGDNADQQIATTTVSFSDGNEPAARIVAKIVGVATTAVQPIDTNTAAAVAPEAKVVVVVGGDRSSAG